MPIPKTGVTAIADSSNANNLDITRKGKIETVAKEGAVCIVNKQNDVFLNIEGGPAYRLNWQDITVAGVAPIGADDARQKIEALLTVPGTAAGGGGAQDVNIIEINSTPLTAAKLPVEGDVQEDAVDSDTNAPVKVGGEAQHFGPVTEVDVRDRISSKYLTSGQQWIIGGASNLQSEEYEFTSAQTDFALVAAASPQRILVTKVSIHSDNGNAQDLNIRIGFGATLAPPSTAGIIGIVLSVSGIPAGATHTEGDGTSIIGIGDDSTALRITCGNPTQAIRVIITYFLSSKV